MDVHSACLASTTSSHSIRARGESGERRWLNSVLIAVVSGEEESSGISLTSRPEQGQWLHVISNAPDSKWKIHRNTSGIISGRDSLSVVSSLHLFKLPRGINLCILRIKKTQKEEMLFITFKSKGGISFC